MIELLAAVALKIMIDGSIPYKHTPKECSGRVCLLTGNGGNIHVWLRHVVANRDKIFVVRGKCMSACEMAYRKALGLGCMVIVAPGARLIPHRRSRPYIE